MDSRDFSVAVCVAVYNEGTKVLRLLEALDKQSLKPDEIIIVNDGSTDNTQKLLEGADKSYIKILHQENSGPAKARNKAWRAARCEICVFTDGDCTPTVDWLRNLIEPFRKDPNLLASGGIYAAPEMGNFLERFVGWELQWRYSQMSDFVDAHGTYSLAVKRKTLENIGGFNESFKKPSGEDFDLTYKISAIKPIRLVKNSTLHHDHPSAFWAYLKNQARRGYDRVRLYIDHPSKIKNDSYTDPWVKFDVLAAGLTPVLAILLATPIEVFAFYSLAGILTYQALSASRLFWFVASRSNFLLGLYAIWIRFVRNYAWVTGMVSGLFSKEIYATK